ncbi:pkb-activating kinase-like protein [Mortierella claussenii]|nr:pkb-activating kinase-like protein [Mortierella claussenii]
MSAPVPMPDHPQVTSISHSTLETPPQPIPPSAPGTTATLPSATPPTPVPRPAIVASASAPAQISASPNGGSSMAPLAQTQDNTATPLVSGSATNGAHSNNGSSNHTPTATPSTAAIPVRKRTLADYKLGRTLGEGSYSTVVEAVDLSNKRNYAIKVLDKRHIIREKKVKYVNIEKNTLYKLEHPGVVKLYSTFQDSSSLYYVLELCQNGELLTFIKKLGSFDENCTRFYVAQILTAVEYVHNQGVIHRDLKPENILLDHRMYIKLTDFGTAKMLEPSEDGAESDRANSFVGTAEYVSPELLTEKAACKSSDLWALGCIIYQLLAGRPPFKGSNEYQTFQKIVKLEYSFPAGFPKTAMDLVSRLLVHDPNERLGANNTIDKLKQHAFFDGVEWTELWKQPAPKLMPYLPPTPAHNTEPLRSDHDACLWDVNRAGETLMVVDPFRELGDSGSSVDNSGRNSMNDSDEGPLKNAGVLEVSKLSTAAVLAAPGPDHVDAPTIASSSLPELSEKTHSTAVISTSEGPKADSNAQSSPAPTIPKSISTSAAADSPIKSASAAFNGHVKSKSSSRNAFVALFSPSSKQSPRKKQLGKKSKHLLDKKQGENLESPRKSDLARENSTVSLAVTASEISAYSRRTQLELQAELSPWQNFLLPTELIIYQTPVQKRKGLFSRSCILVLTDFPRLLYFDDSNHYFSQLFSSNTNDAYSCWQQQQRVVQWEQLELQHLQFSLHQQLGGLHLDVLQHPQQHRLYHHPSLSQESQNHQQQQLNAIHQPLHQHGALARRSLNGKETVPTTGSGFVLSRSTSGKHHQQSRSEHIPASAIPENSEDGSMSMQSTRASLEHPPHQHPPPHPTHHRQQSNGYNKIDVERRISVSEPVSGPLLVPGIVPLSSSTTSSQTNLAPVATPVTGSRSNITLSTATTATANEQQPSKGVHGSTGNSSSSRTSSVAPPVSPAMIKASKKQAKLRGEILFTASVVSEVKGKKCFFIHTTKKSYYFEEYREGDAKLWVKVLERCMEEWFGERGGATVATVADGPDGDKAPRHSK